MGNDSGHHTVMLMLFFDKFRFFCVVLLCEIFRLTVRIQLGISKT